MCGIVGCWLAQPQRFHQAAGDVGVALEALKHRGPDDCGLWHDPSRRVILGHRRLAIIDLSPGGHQPMPFFQESGEQEVLVVFNGEIYNYLELKQQLEPHGYEFYSDSDTEVLLAAYHHYGQDFVDHLRGMFALAIWDGRSKRLLLARDRAGKKPLYYTVNDGGLYFASELNALRELVPGGQLSIDREAVDGFLSFGSMLGRRTIYKNVYELPPATIAECRAPRELSERRYWQVDWTPRRKIRWRDAVSETDRILREAVRLRMRSDVPVGVFLSGGIDSGLITALAAEMTDQPITTLCVVSDNPDLDERSLARAVARRYGTDHHEITIEPDIAQQLPAIARQYGEPFADASAVPSYLVSEAAAYHCTVVLNGDGGDELFCGYRRHVAARMVRTASRLPGGAFGSKLARLALMLMPSPRSDRSKYALLHRLLRCLTTAGAERTLVLSSDGFGQREKQALYADDFEALSIPALLGAEFEELGRLGPVESMVAFDFESSLPDALLVKMDIASMAHSIETRSPLLDQEVIEWAFSLPMRTRLPGRTTKPVLRALAKRYLPPEVVRAPKRGFEIPVRQWLTGELREMRDDLILNPHGLMGELFDRDKLQLLLSPRGRRRMSSSRWTSLVWSLLMLALWDQECWTGRQTLPRAKSA